MSSNPRSPSRAASLFVVLLILVGCSAVPVGTGSGQPSYPTGTFRAATLVSPTSAPVEGTRPAATGSAASTATAQPSAVTPASTPHASATAQVSPLPAVGPRFGPAWGDRSIYEPGLVSGEQKVLAELAGASEYRIDLEH